MNNAASAPGATDLKQQVLEAAVSIMIRSQEASMNNYIN